jgi:hypothetical protein
MAAYASSEVVIDDELQAAPGRLLDAKGMA